jgi:hypothetical protein
MRKTDATTLGMALGFVIAPLCGQIMQGRFIPKKVCATAPLEAVWYAVFIVKVAVIGAVVVIFSIAIERWGGKA